MAAATHLRPAALEAAGPGAQPRRALSLQRTTRGWALFDDHERAVFEADGPNARRRCLAHASTHGVLRLTFNEQLHAA